MIVWWVVTSVVLVVVVPVVIMLANRVIRAATEISRYGDDILEHGVILSANLDPVPALADTARLVRQVSAVAVRYVSALDRLG